LFHHNELINSNISSIVHHDSRVVLETNLKKLYDYEHRSLSVKIDQLKFYDSFKDLHN